MSKINNISEKYKSEFIDRLMSDYGFGEHQANQELESYIKSCDEPVELFKDGEFDADEMMSYWDI